MNPVSTRNIGKWSIVIISFRGDYLEPAPLSIASFTTIFARNGLDIANVTAAAGDDAPVRLAGLKDVEIVTGKYLIKRRENPSLQKSYNVPAGKRL